VCVCVSLLLCAPPSEQKYNNVPTTITWSSDPTRSPSRRRLRVERKPTFEFASEWHSLVERRVREPLNPVRAGLCVCVCESQPICVLEPWRTHSVASVWALGLEEESESIEMNRKWKGEEREAEKDQITEHWILFIHFSIMSFNHME